MYIHTWRRRKAWTRLCARHLCFIIGGGSFLTLNAYNKLQAHYHMLAAVRDRTPSTCTPIAITRSILLSSSKLYTYKTDTRNNNNNNTMHYIHTADDDILVSATAASIISRSGGVHYTRCNICAAKIQLLSEGRKYFCSVYTYTLYQCTMYTCV